MEIDDNAALMLQRQMEAVAEAAQRAAKSLEATASAVGIIGAEVRRIYRRYIARAVGPMPVRDGLRFLGGRRWCRPRVLAAWVRSRINYMNLRISERV
jgi:hypothetical protein